MRRDAPRRGPPGRPAGALECGCARAGRGGAGRGGPGVRVRVSHSVTLMQGRGVFPRDVRQQQGLAGPRPASLHIALRALLGTNKGTK